MKKYLFSKSIYTTLGFMRFIKLIGVYLFYNAVGAEKEFWEKYDEPENAFPPKESKLRERIKAAIEKRRKK